MEDAEESAFSFFGLVIHCRMLGIGDDSLFAEPVAYRMRGVAVLAYFCTQPLHLQSCPFIQQTSSMNSPMRTRTRTFFPLLIAAVVVFVLILVTVLFRGRAGVQADPANDAVTDTTTAEKSRGSASRGDAVSARLPISRQDAQDLAMRSIERRREGRKESVKRGEVTRARIAAQFDAEKVDPAWAPGKQVDLEKISSLPEITTSVQPPKSMSVACRSSMCRIDSTFDSSGSAEDWTMLYMASVGSALPTAVVSRVQNSDGTVSVRIYGRAR